jgi:hypothetical protein
MNDRLYNYIYDAMNWVLEYMDDECTNCREQYEKLDKAIGKFQNWYEESSKKLEEIQSICIGADSPDAIEHGERDPIEELQCCREDISAISNIVEQIMTTLGD